MDEDYTASSSAGGKKLGKQHNTLPFWGNENSMNLNPLILANIQSSSYFKVHLFKLKTYHEVVDEIYYQVKHMEPWERGSRKTSGQTGMCGGVRGVGAGGIVSTAYCLLYKLYTLRLTRKQVNGLLNHTDSPYIRALGFMYLRYTQPPADLYDWYEDYLQDEEEIDVKAGGGQVVTIGQMVFQFMTKLDWFSTLFPRIPVPIQKQTEKRIEQYCREQGITQSQLSSGRAAVSGGNAAAAVGSSGGGTAAASSAGTDYEYAQAAQERGRGGAVARAAYPPAVNNYRNDHDDRDYYGSSTSSSNYARARYEEYPPAAPASLSSDREKESGSRRSERHRSKHKKKSKHRHYSRSRSRSGSRSRPRSERHERRRDDAGAPYERSSRHRYDEHQQHYEAAERRYR